MTETTSDGRGRPVVAIQILLLLVPTVPLPVAAILSLLHEALAPRRRRLAGGVVLVL